MNTHYAIAAIYALGLRGIRNKIAVTSKPYGQPGSTYAELPKLPTSLESATALFKRPDSLAREVFGDFFVDHFEGTREHECEVHRRAVTAWEGEYLSLSVVVEKGKGRGSLGKRRRSKKVEQMVLSVMD